jgi:hypothetical protein
MAGLMAGLAIAGLAVGIGTTAMSFAEKAKQEKAAREAAARASGMMAKAREKLKVNFADALAINKEPYEREREAMLSAGAQLMEQSIESERGGAATAGRVLAAQQEGQGQVRDKMGQDLFNLEAMQAEEDSRLRDINVQMDLGEVAGAQAAAAEAENAANVAQQQGIQGIGNVVQQGLNMVPLYQKGADARAVNKLERQAGRAGVDVNEYVKKNSYIQAATGTAGSAQIGNVGDDNYKAAVTQSSDYVPQKNLMKWGDGNVQDVTGLLNAKGANQMTDWWNQQDDSFTNNFRTNSLGLNNKNNGGFWGNPFGVFGN